MPQFFRLTIFALAFVVGVAVTYPFALTSWFNRETPRFESINAQERFYTLAEAKEKIGRRVRHAQPAAHNPSRGHVASIDMIIPDKFFVVVYWDTPPDNGKPGLRWYSKDVHEKYIVEEAAPTCAF